MVITPAQATELIRKRRAIFPKSYNTKPISKQLIEEILENANHAPNHRLTQPWRFKVVVDNGLERLSGYMSDYYRKTTPEESFSEVKFEKTKASPLRSACVIAICMQPDPEKKVPEWEEIAAVACAVQNMWLTCTAHGIGAYWSTPEAALRADDFFQLKNGERCLGLFYMGYHDMPELPAKRTPIAEKTQWIVD